MSFRTLHRAYSSIENVIKAQFLETLEGNFPSQYIHQEIIVVHSGTFEHQI